MEQASFVFSTLASQEDLVTDRSIGVMASSQIWFCTSIQIGRLPGRIYLLYLFVSSLSCLLMIFNCTKIGNFKEIPLYYPCHFSVLSDNSPNRSVGAIVLHLRWVNRNGKYMIHQVQGNGWETFQAHFTKPKWLLQSMTLPVEWMTRISNEICVVHDQKLTDQLHYSFSVSLRKIQVEWVAICACKDRYVIFIINLFCVFCFNFRLNNTGNGVGNCVLDNSVCDWR